MRKSGPITGWPATTRARAAGGLDIRSRERIVRISVAKCDSRKEITAFTIGRIAANVFDCVTLRGRVTGSPAK